MITTKTRFHPLAEGNSILPSRIPKTIIKQSLATPTIPNCSYHLLSELPIGIYFDANIVKKSTHTTEDSNESIYTDSTFFVTTFGFWISNNFWYAALWSNVHPWSSGIRHFMQNTFWHVQVQTTWDFLLHFAQRSILFVNHIQILLISVLLL